MYKTLLSHVVVVVQKQGFVVSAFPLARVSLKSCCAPVSWAGVRACGNVLPRAAKRTALLLHYLLMGKEGADRESVRSQPRYPNNVSRFFSKCDITKKKATPPPYNHAPHFSSFIHHNTRLGTSLNVSFFCFSQKRNSLHSIDQSSSSGPE